MLKYATNAIEIEQLSQLFCSDRPIVAETRMSVYVWCWTWKRW